MRIVVGIACFALLFGACGGGNGGGGGAGGEFDLQAFCDKEKELGDMFDSGDAEATPENIQELADLAPEELDDDFELIIQVVEEYEAAETDEERAEVEERWAGDEEYGAAVRAMGTYINENCRTASPS